MIFLIFVWWQIQRLFVVAAGTHLQTLLVLNEFVQHFDTRLMSAFINFPVPVQLVVLSLLSTQIEAVIQEGVGDAIREKCTDSLSFTHI